MGRFRSNHVYPVIWSSSLRYGNGIYCEFAFKLVVGCKGVFILRHIAGEIETASRCDEKSRHWQSATAIALIHSDPGVDRMNIRIENDYIYIFTIIYIYILYPYGGGFVVSPDAATAMFLPTTKRDIFSTLSAVGSSTHQRACAPRRHMSNRLGQPDVHVMAVIT